MYFTIALCYSFPLLTYGQADNAGILTIATTNHPERIDDAILNRPSRFDVKYSFTLPGPALREAFATRWLAKVNRVSANTGLAFTSPETTAAEVAEKTDGWSFAFLKELFVPFLPRVTCISPLTVGSRCFRFVSFLLRVAHDKSQGRVGAGVPSESVEGLLMKQVEQLADQIMKTKGEDAEEEDASEEAT